MVGKLHRQTNFLPSMTDKPVCSRVALNSSAMQLIGASLSEPHTSGTALCTCVCMFACLLACLLACGHIP